MTYDNASEMSAQQRAALITWLLARGHSLTILEIAQIAQMSPHGARDMMDRIGGAVPITKNGKQWKLLTD